MPQQQVLDYEVVALAYRAVQDCEQESEAFEHALSIADLRPREVLPSHNATGVAYVLGYAVAGPLSTLRGEIEWRRWRWRWLVQASAGRRSRCRSGYPAAAGLRGLFMSADANFEKLVRELFSFDTGDALTHLGLMLVYMWLIGGMLHEMLVAPLRPERPSRVRLNIVEVSVVLTAL